MNSFERDAVSTVLDAMVGIMPPSEDELREACIFLARKVYQGRSTGIGPIQVETSWGEGLSAYVNKEIKHEEESTR